MREQLLLAGLYLSAYEMLVGALLTYPGSPALPRDPKSRSHQRLEKTTLDWWRIQGALSLEDLQAIRDIREKRHEVAHELLTFLIDDAWDVPDGGEIDKVLVKIRKWWVRQRRTEGQAYAPYARAIRSRIRALAYLHDTTLQMFSRLS